jgi:hypothetical protein
MTHNVVIDSLMRLAAGIFAAGLLVGVALCALAYWALA